MDGSTAISYYNLLQLVGGLEHFLFFHILGIIIPTDFHVFQRGRAQPPTRKIAHLPRSKSKYKSWKLLKIKLILIHIKPVGAGETFPGISSMYWISNGDVCNLYSKILTPQGNSVPLITSHGYFKLPEVIRGTHKPLKSQWKAWFSVFSFIAMILWNSH